MALSTKKGREQLNEMKNYFIGTKAGPFHLSVGAVVMNKNGEVFCHHFPKGEKNPEFYLLMRETVKPKESLEEAVTRGLKEEFGMKGRATSYLGSIQSTFTNWEGAPVKKVTLYFLCRPGRRDSKWITSKETKRGHFGRGSALEWQSARFLIAHMKRQGKEMKRSDFDESAVVERALKSLGGNRKSKKR